jgi:hypothetical protein
LANASTSLGNTGNFGFIESTTSVPCNKPWIIDSGASNHMTNDSKLFLLYTTTLRNTVKVANGLSTPVLGAGSIPLSSSLSLSSVLHVPSLSNNLMSISQITKHLNCCAIFFSTHCLFQDILTKKLIGLGRERGGLYYLDLKEAPVLEAGHVYQVGTEESKAREKIWLWHRRLGHPSFQYLQHLFPSLFSKVNISNFHSEPCIYAKNHCVSFLLSFNKSDFPFSLIHTDVWGPSTIPTYTGVQWFVSFIDDCTWVSWVYLMKTKSDVFPIFQIFHQMIRTQFNAQVQVVRSDNGREYPKKGFNAYFQQNGIIHQTSCVTTP